MSAPFGLWLLAVFVMAAGSLQAGGSFACGGSLTFTKDGKSVPIRGEGSISMMNDLQAFLQSCSVENSGGVVSEEKWNEMLAHPVGLHYKLPGGYAFGLNLSGGLRIEVQEAILPIQSGSYPDYIYVKNKNGYFAYSKYDPYILRRIAEFPAIGLIAESPYRSLPKKEDGAR